MRKTLVGIAVLALTIGSAACRREERPVAASREKAQTTELQILGLNDFHGALEPPTGSAGRLDPPGRRSSVASSTSHARPCAAGDDQPEHTVRVAGDLIGATPLVSALFHDEPTIEANLMGLDYNGVGNHEFDEGVDELLRMQNGGCHPTEGCFGGDGFDGASFDFLAANVPTRTPETDLPAVRDPPLQRRQGGHRRNDARGHAADRHAGRHLARQLLRRGRHRQRARAVLKAQNVETIIVLLHEGGNTSVAGNGAGAGADQINQCVNTTGAIPPIVDRMDDEIDVSSPATRTGPSTA